MKKRLYNIIKGNFLISDDAFKNWRFIIFLSVLALIMIASSHSADKKVHQIAKLNNEVKEVKSHYVDLRMKVMQVKMESRITSIMEKKGLKIPVTPPQKIYIKKAEEE